MKKFMDFPKLKRGDKVAVLSPSFGAPGIWPHVYELGLKRLREIFDLTPVEFPTTKQVGASTEKRAEDLIAAFENKEIKGVISSIGGDDQVTYIKNLPPGPFINNPKPFFGFSDNTHFANFLWLHGIPSYYGGSLFGQIAEPEKINDFTLKYLKIALFGQGQIELEKSGQRSDYAFDWSDPKNLNRPRIYESDEGWSWDGNGNAEGISWGGCLESIDEMLRHGVPIPSLENFENIFLITETSEELPARDYVFRVYRALGERGILKRLKAILVGRPKAEGFNQLKSNDEKTKYRKEQRETILAVVRKYNPSAPLIQNLDFGHTEPQIAMPYGKVMSIDSKAGKIWGEF